MQFLIETEDQLKEFLYKGFEEVFIVAIPQNYNYHPALSTINSLYIKDLKTNQSYLIPIQHTETLKLKVDVKEILSKYKTIYTFDKKQQLHLSQDFINSIDIGFDYSFNYRDLFCPTLNYFYKTYPTLRNLNALIPVVKLYELWENITQEAFGNHSPHLNPYIRFASNQITSVFYNIEKNVIGLDTNTFDDYFTIPHHQYNIVENSIYSQYNLYNTTTRPSNHFNGVNFLAINKDTGERQSFIPQNDIFVEMDFSAYHPTLCGKIIGEDFVGYDKVVEQLGIDKSEAKQKTFRFLYGGIQEGLEEVDWFKKVSYFINNLWDEFETQGYIENPISKKRFYRDKLENINKQKLFNYLLQSLETAISVEKLTKVLDLLENQNTKVVLYVYDSILLDVDKEEKNILKDIKSILEEDGFKVGLSYGKNYHELKKLK